MHALMIFDQLILTVSVYALCLIVIQGLNSRAVSMNLPINSII